MEILSAKCLSDELEMNDALSNFMCDQYDMDCLDLIDLEDDGDHHHHEQQLNYFQSSSPDEGNIHTPTICSNYQQNTTTKSSLPVDKERVKFKSSRNWNSRTSAAPIAKMVSTTTTSSSAALISFNNSSSNSTATATALVPSSEKNYYLEYWGSTTTATTSDQFYVPKQTQNCTQKCNNKQGVRRVGSISTNTRSPLHARDHVIAERKRREKLNQKFIALSAVIPGLKKMDKASVLGDAINYVKHLEERVRTLEEQQEMKTKNHESVILMKKSLLCAVEDSSSDNDMVLQPLSEIEARVSNKDVLIRIYCEKQYGGCNLANLLTKIENLHLTIVNTSALPLGSSTIDITIVAQMDVEFCMTHNELKENLRQALLM
ncbi:transcription factor NAI1-like [Humulus lupulus]|uniref:transcription factor NAI1-like n=1 Tax=Humulus lupulus TaxID=3486 RepID=UPI002B41813F|nr:transcription factor NAI1-like [Humulus lupulus]